MWCLKTHRCRRLGLHLVRAVRACQAELSSSPANVVVRKEEVWRFVRDCVLASGATEVHASDLADLLSEADHRGHFSHGLNYLNHYVDDLRHRIVNVDADPTVVKESVSTALVDGNNVLGPTVAKFAMRVAMRKAKETGVGWVSVRNANHFGIAGFYSMMAAKEGLVGLSFTNSSPVVFPTRAKTVILGSNPISAAAPAADPEDDFVLDVATSTVAIGKVVINDKKGLPIPPSWGADKHGSVTTDPAEVLDGGGGLPLGGTEENGGYKGYGLALMVDLFCGVMSGGAFGGDVEGWTNPDKSANCSHCLAALNPDMFADGFRGRVSDFCSSFRSAEPSGDLPVLVPGDPERAHMAACADRGGIPYPPVLIASMNELAQDCKVSPLEALK